MFRQAEQARVTKLTGSGTSLYRDQQPAEDQELGTRHDNAGGKNDCCDDVITGIPEPGNTAQNGAFTAATGKTVVHHRQ
ncbi:hypothetical protein SRABI106_04220 [Rahnella aquatilis]|nr:hypothetical protein SRABI106_04220 [Rahnella aquatilis]